MRNGLLVATLTGIAATLYSEIALAHGGETVILGVVVIAAALGGGAGVVGGFREWGFGLVFLWCLGGLIVCGFVISLISLIHDSSTDGVTILIYGPIMFLILGILPSLLIAEFGFLTSEWIRRKWKRGGHEARHAP